MKNKFLLFMLILFAGCTNPKKQEQGTEEAIPGKKWWKELIIYQIYPRENKSGIELPETGNMNNILINNYPNIIIEGKKIALLPFQAVVLDLK